MRSAATRPAAQAARSAIDGGFVLPEPTMLTIRDPDISEPAAGLRCLRPFRADQDSLLGRDLRNEAPQT